MIVTAGTLEGEAEEGGAGGGDHVVEVISALLKCAFDRLVADDVVSTGDEETGGGVVEPMGRGRGEGVTGELLEYESRERCVLIEGVDDVIAIWPG